MLAPFDWPRSGGWLGRYKSGAGDQNGGIGNRRGARADSEFVPERQSARRIDSDDSQQYESERKETFEIAHGRVRALDFRSDARPRRPDLCRPRGQRFRLARNHSTWFLTACLTASGEA